MGYPLLVFADNNFVPGSNTPIATSDSKGNIFQKRKLLDGEEYLILKNFPERDDFAQLLKGRGQNMQLISPSSHELREGSIYKCECVNVNSYYISYT